jgi:hypothetical protein
MMGCPTHFDAAQPSEFPAYVRNAGNLTPDPFPSGKENRSFREWGLEFV